METQILDQVKVAFFPVLTKKYPKLSTTLKANIKPDKEGSIGSMN